jgi:hypothetical protein
MTQQTHLRSIDDQARFTAAKEVTDNSATPPGGQASDPSRSPAKARADKALPTDRLRFNNQEQVLLEVAHLSGNSRRGCTAEEMSASIGLKGGTGGLNSRFFRSAGWFEGVGRGLYTASQGLREYARHITIDPDDQFTASALMRDESRKSWFWNTLEPMLETGRPLAVRTALLALAKEAGASDHAAQLETIVEWLAWVGLIVREGDSIRLREASELVAQESIAELDQQNGAGLESDHVVIDEEVGPTPVVEPARQPVEDTGALVSFNLSVRLTADDVKELSDEKMQFLIDFASKLRG